ncbi:ThuA domain-containing protein [Humisphaera borealis]|uniref:ThuA domain-containing protein n=1 Tax=Humisphaera borealis TaxID=2807512 RepID=A0A7M2WUJ5_9BACT|nr:ThuA domain-containing protein [Humisphaera borealis]QOV89195.1 ThuA domain-containing protein [Humisphaera borealis]
MSTVWPGNTCDWGAGRANMGFMIQRLVLAVVVLVMSMAAQLPAADPALTRVLVWDERQPAQKQAYDPWLGDTIADYLRKQPGFEVRSVGLSDPEQGLSDAILDSTDVIVWWGHQKHRDVLPATAKRIADRIEAGKLSLVALHSAHWATPFVEAMNRRATADAMKLLTDAERKSAKVTFVTPLPGKPPSKTTPMTPSAEKKVDAATGQVELIIRLPICCFPSWRNDGKPSHVTTLLAEHPIAKGVPAKFDIPHTEMYDEPFHVPSPDAVVFEEKWDAGEHFRSGMVWNVGKGKVFYFRPGHETHAVYKEAAPLKIVENACRWMAEAQRSRANGMPAPAATHLAAGQL